MVTSAVPTGDRTTDQPLPRQRWMPLSLRVFAVIVGVPSLGSLLWLDFAARQEKESIRKIESWGAKFVTTEPIAPVWLQEVVGYDRLRQLTLFERIVEVNLCRSEVPHAEIDHLGALKNLEFLTLSNGWSNLEILERPGRAKTDAVLVPLSRLTNLRELDLDGTAVTDAGLVHLAGLKNLVQFNLGVANVTDAGLVHVSRLINLTSLSLRGAGVTDAGLVHLAGLKNLRKLDLAATRVTDAGLVHLTGLKDLVQLELSDTRVTDAGLVHLGGLKNLLEVDLVSTVTTDEGIKQLRGKLPASVVRR